MPIPSIFTVRRIFPTRNINPAAVAFWEQRRRYDAYVLEHAVPVYQLLNVTQDGYPAVLEQIVAACCG